MGTKRECRRASRQLWDYVAGRLPDDEGDQVEKHLSCCPACAQQAEQWRKTVQLMKCYREQPVPPSDRTWVELRGRLEAEKRRGAASMPPGKISFSALGGAAFLSALSLALIVYVGRTPGSDEWTGGLYLNKVVGAPVRLATKKATTGIHVSMPAPKVGETGNLVSRNSVPEKESPMVSSRPAKRPSLFQPPQQYASGRAVIRPGRRRPISPMEVILADGDRAASGASRRDFVLGAAANASDRQPAREYVIGSIPPSLPEIGAASYTGKSEELTPW
jgi:hypothetical protein